MVVIKLQSVESRDNSVSCRDLLTQLIILMHLQYLGWRIQLLYILILIAFLNSEELFFPILHLHLFCFVPFRQYLFVFPEFYFFFFLLQVLYIFLCVLEVGFYPFFPVFSLLFLGVHFFLDFGKIFFDQLAAFFTGQSNHLELILPLLLGLLHIKLPELSLLPFEPQFLFKILLSMLLVDCQGKCVPHPQVFVGIKPVYLLQAIWQSARSWSYLLVQGLVRGFWVLYHD